MHFNNGKICVILRDYKICNFIVGGEIRPSLKKSTRIEFNKKYKIIFILYHNSKKMNHIIWQSSVKWSWAFYNCCENGGQNGLGLIQEYKIIEIFMKMPYVGLDTTASGLLGWHTKQ